MLEGLVTWVLNNYLGRYVENLNTDQLSIALLSGEVELENLPLRKDALRHLGAPIEIRAGFVGKVRLSIPVRQPRSAPWVISLERLYVVAGPVRLETWDDNAEKLAEHERKLSGLDALEACWRQERETRPGVSTPPGNGPGGYYASSYASWLSYGTGLISDIVENIQLKVEKVHIRYEDGPGGSAGVTIRSLSAQSCDNTWKPQFTHRTANQPYSYKTVDLTEMSIYWEPEGAGPPMSELTMDELATAMESDTIQKSYIVAPVSGYAHVSRNRSEQPLRSSSEPRIVIELCLDSVPVFLADWQYELATMAINTLNYVSEIQRQRRHRPTSSPSDQPLQWWTYALRSTGSAIYPSRRVRSWTEILLLASENVKYVRLYERILSQPAASISHEDKQLKEHVEWTRDFDQLRSLRQISMRRVQSFAPPPITIVTDEPSRGRSLLAGWFPQWWGWYSTVPEIEKPETPKPDEEELLEILSEAVRDNTVLKRDVVFGRFTFGLKSGFISLSTGPELKPAMELQFEAFHLTIESRPRSASYSLELALGTLRLRDLLTEGTLFPALVSERGTSLTTVATSNLQEPLFKLRFEALPRGARKLKVKSRPLEVVYQPEAAKWLVAFALGPHRKIQASQRLEAVKARTKEQLMKNWESIVEMPDRPTHVWDLQLDISAPQIIFVESFSDPNAIIGVVDLGRLHVINTPDTEKEVKNDVLSRKTSLVDEEDDEMFQTPCSTPPGSETSITETMATAQTDILDETMLHSRIYERYSAELTDMQVLTCRVRDGWRHAHTRGSSAMHVLERFSISACLERRLVRTQDPMYPALALSGQLPRLVLHVNENKVNAVRTLWSVVGVTTLQTDDVGQCLDLHENDDVSISIDDSTTVSDTWQSSRLLMLQFTVEQASVQLQSRGRSIAELQVTGASATMTKRPLDTGLTVTVHGLLLVDALQTYGPDFELLVASHRHVAMDSVSGSLRDSEPTSPCSPGSPDPYQGTMTSPLALTTALSGLASVSPPPHEALICIEYTIVDGIEPVRIANIQFNNLDVIANQETVVELVGFTRRVFPSKTGSKLPQKTVPYSTNSSRVELTFDFHRLNVLLMRGIRDEFGDPTGRKVATLSACGARIRATVDGGIASVHASLDGLQLLDLTQEGRIHRRIVSVGRDPLEDVLPHGLYRIQQDDNAPRAFEAIVNKIVPDRVDVEIRMGSVWYVHSPRLLSELQSCAAEFKHYLSDVASRIGAAAADVVVHQLYGHRGSIHHVSASIDSISGIGSTPDDETAPTRIHLDVILDSPVVVLPRNAMSSHVFVAHLGRISIRNSMVDESEAYQIDFRDMNLYSLDTTPRRVPGPSVPRAEKLYSCESLAEPVLHDTVLHINIVVTNGRDLDHDEGVLLEDSDSSIVSERLEITGSVVNELRVSLTREQYEQLLETFQSLTSDNEGVSKSRIDRNRKLHDIPEDEQGVGTLRMDPHVRAGMFPTAVGRAASAATSFRQLHLGFELPVFTVELRREQSVELSFINFSFSLEKSVPYETHIQVSLRSLRMDDLSRPVDDPVRHMVISRSGSERRSLQVAAFASHSFPERLPNQHEQFGSLPDHLETRAIFGAPTLPRRPPAPPDNAPNNRPLTENLVLISCLLVDPNSAPDFQKQYSSLQRATHVDFNALDLAVKADSWALVFDFFGGGNNGNDIETKNVQMESSIVSENDDFVETQTLDAKSELKISVRSLTIMFLREDGKNIARSNVSRVSLKRITNVNNATSVTDGRLGSMSITDLTEHGVLYRERFRTLGEQALCFCYKSSNAECSLRLEMATVLYVHTRRFFTEFQGCLSGFGGKSNGNGSESGKLETKPTRTWTSLEIQAGAPVILLPVSSGNEHLLVADLGKLLVSNQLEVRTGRLLDVMRIELLDMDLYSAKRVLNGTGIDLSNGVTIDRSGRSLLDQKCRLVLNVERGLSEGEINEPDLSICGDLSALKGTLDLQNYRLIRGLLAHNIGEQLENANIDTNREVASVSSTLGVRSTVTVIRLGLQNVTVRLNEDSGVPLGSVHFISSRLTLESFSDGAQDIDLLSQEILIVDTRPEGLNAFTDILSPGCVSDANEMQAEVHSRRRSDYSEFTVLLNNMRVMLIPDWWRNALNYIFSSPMESHLVEKPESSPRQSVADDTGANYEFKLNVTNSEIVVVQDTADRDTNALTLRSTTVLSYRPNADKPLSCNLNHCELFSCVPGHENDTALSIIDPVTVGVELSSSGLLEMHFQQRLNIRLSYHDMLMLADMARNVPEQLGSNRDEVDDSETEAVRKLVTLGFAPDDCRDALKECEGQIEEAALWLTQNASHRIENENSQKISTLLIRATCIVLTIIDDCGDADVPLAELCLSELTASKPLNNCTESWLECRLSCDYYNRALSGWEPCIEPWKCRITVESNTRLLINVASDSLLDINITSALLELYRLVSDSWTNDIHSITSDNKQSRHRSRFVPFALKNDTGSPIYFNTTTSKLEYHEEVNVDSELDLTIVLASNSNWKKVEAGETIPFDFGDNKSGRRRHGDTHRPRLHVLAVRVTGWSQTARVSVDRVGVYFREVGGREGGEPPRARLVFDVRLEGSARKLVTVRSALMLENLLPDPVDIRLGVCAELTVEPGSKVPVPLEHSHRKLHVKPRLITGPNFTYCLTEVDWRLSAQRAGERKHEARKCISGGRQNGVYYLSIETRREYYPADSSLPAHSVVLVPGLLIVNLLPHELHFNVGHVTTPDRDKESSTSTEGVIKPGGELAVSTIDPNFDKSELKLRLEGFRCRTGVRLPSIDSSSNEQQCRVRLEDALGRRLNLRCHVSVCGPTAGVRVAVSAQYWIVNKTGLPLVFRQEGVPADAAGQYEEHEVARMVAPLLFSWADEEAGPSVICRVGNVAVPGQPQWCQPFHLRRGVQVRRLHVSHFNDSKPDTIFVLGIEVRPGRGRYRKTSIVTLSPRHQIHNRSAHTLIFSQRCLASSVRDPGAAATHVFAVPGCQVPFHWPRLDREQLLCVRIGNEVGTGGVPWSGSLRIDQPRSLHVSLRDGGSGDVRFLRLEVLPRGSTMHAVFSDPADTLPPPLRVDNMSEVTITFTQQDVPHSCVVRPGASIAYAWDEPDRGNQALVVTAPGGATAAVDMDNLGPVAQLTYENFIYVAFIGTFPENQDDCPVSDRVDDQRLVLDVIEDGGRVSLAPKQPGRRSQLWRMTSTGQLHHEGSPADRVLVLDIADPAPQPSKRDSRLALRRPDLRRRSTQTWRFTAEGRLCCAHDNMCVQSQGGLFGLRAGGAAVLGVVKAAPEYRNQKIPKEQAVGKQRMRPGSGFLSVEVMTDGPTRVLSVRDVIAERRKRAIAAPSTTVEETNPNPGKEIRIVVRLSEGVGVSIVGGGPPQELLYSRLSGIVAETTSSPSAPATRQLCLSIADIQCDNQLFDTDTEVVIYASPRNRSSQTVEWQGPALNVSAELQPPLPGASVVIFRHLVVKVNPLSVHVDETLLLRLMEFLNGGGRVEEGKKEETREVEDDDDEMKPGADTAATSTRTRYYVGVMSLSPGPVRLSMRTAGKLPQRLRILRRRLGLTLIQFEDASICVEPYRRRHLFDTAKGLWRGVQAHFREELVWQAAIILGNVDFLGGPLGLVSDVTEGVSGLINERSVGALVMNVTHGLSNSAAKVTDALGDGLGRVLIMDEAHEEARQRIRRAGGGGSHLVAGIKGLGFGLLDGATGLFRHVYEGAANDGVQGAFAGVGRGLVGMVAKPVVGVLDFAGETARAVRDSSRGSARQTPIRKRQPRVAAMGPGGLLPRYGSGKEARGQKYLHKLNGGDLTERFVAYGSLRSSEIDDLRLVLGSEKLRVVTTNNTDMTVVTEFRLDEVYGCAPVSDDNKNYVELSVRTGTAEQMARRPRIRCDTPDIARWAARQVNFARRMLSERRYTLRAPDGGDAASTPQ